LRTLELILTFDENEIRLRESHASGTESTDCIFLVHNIDGLVRRKRLAAKERKRCRGEVANQEKRKPLQHTFFLSWL
jgi:hypothetical protein